MICINFVCNVDILKYQAKLHRIGAMGLLYPTFVRENSDLAIHQ